jgi:hypothetical protein
MISREHLVILAPMRWCIDVCSYVVSNEGTQRKSTVDTSSATECTIYLQSAERTCMSVNKFLCSAAVRRQPYSWSWANRMSGMQGCLPNRTSSQIRGSHDYLYSDQCQTHLPRFQSSRSWHCHRIKKRTCSSSCVRFLSDWLHPAKCILNDYLVTAQGKWFLSCGLTRVLRSEHLSRKPTRQHVIV